MSSPNGENERGTEQPTVADIGPVDNDQPEQERPEAQIQVSINIQMQPSTVNNTSSSMAIANQSSAGAPVQLSLDVQTQPSTVTGVQVQPSNSIANSITGTTAGPANQPALSAGGNVGSTVSALSASGTNQGNTAQGQGVLTLRITFVLRARPPSRPNMIIEELWDNVM